MPDYKKKLEALQAGIANFGEKIPKTTTAFMRLHEQGAKSNVLDAKTKELIAIAIAIISQCEDCISMHVHDGLEAGITEEEMYDMINVAVLMGGGPALCYSSHVVEAMNQFKEVKAKAS